MGTIGIMLEKPTMGQILARAAAEQEWFKTQMAEMGHTTHTMLWNDFTIADYFGTKAITDTYNKVLKACKTWDETAKKYKYNEKVVAELCIVLNWKINVFYGKNDPLAIYYNNLWDECRDFADKHLTKEQLSYYYEVTD